MEQKHHILVIDDDEFTLSLLVTVLSRAGYRVSKAASGESGLYTLEKEVPDLVVTDYKMPGISGLEVLREITRSRPGLPVIMLTGHGDVSLTIKAIQAGAYDFIEKPIKNWELLESIQNGIRASMQSQSLSSVIAPHARKAIEENLLAGKTPAMREIFKNIGRISLSNVNVMITGEAGTGKEQIARLIHYSGINRDHPFVTVNCHSAEEKMLEHELFGYAKNALEGISGEKKGKFEMVGEGTLFLNEFAHLSERMQHKLLRVLQNNEFEKPGEEKPLPLKPRIVAATQENIHELVAEGTFLAELYFRLNIFTLHIPPLRERQEDIPELVRILLQKLNRRLNRQVLKIENGVEEVLKKYHWPGNIRELENILVQAMILTHGDVLELKSLSISQDSPVNRTEVPAELVPLSEIEKEHIRKVLNAVGWNKVEASKILQITRPTLNTKIKKYGLSA
ncbi:MAG: sigma-54-dependent transcriptional regulator [Bacteroidales bacterium]